MHTDMMMFVLEDTPPPLSPLLPYPVLLFLAYDSFDTATGITAHARCEIYAILDQYQHHLYVRRSGFINLHTWPTWASSYRIGPPLFR